MTDCVFCKIVERKIPASVVYEDGETIAFMDIGAVNPGHTLVVAKPHVENVFGLDDALAARLAQTTARVARAVQWAFQPPGMSVYQANGAPAGQTVMHYHVHVVPRWENDGMDLVWPVKNPPREELAANAEKIKAALAAG
ncbi:MAG: HIT family protein [Burkholderiales bacterium]|jgi:histidine triad (HIT) family protein|nr:HIT family protein [Burkholderiales bacterium]